MKKAYTLLVALVLTASVLTGCGCRNYKPTNTSTPTTMPPVTTEATTEMTTMPTVVTTEPTNATIQDGNGPISTDATTSTDETDMARSHSRGMVGGTGTGNGITGSITG